MGGTKSKLEATYERPREVFQIVRIRDWRDSLPYLPIPTPESVFNTHREFLCKAQNFCRVIMGFPPITYEDNECPCYCCSDIMLFQDLHRRRGTRQDHELQMHMGHLIADTNGGKKEIQNLFPICSRCNLSMNKRLPNNKDFLFSILVERGTDKGLSIAYRHNVACEQDVDCDYIDRYDGFLGFLESLSKTPDQESQ